MRTFLCSAMSLVLAVGAAGAQPTTMPAKPYKLFLLIGQSNMAGRGKIEEADRQPHPRVLKLTKDDTWAPAVDPLHFDKPSMVGVGLGTTFGKTIAGALPDQIVGLIPCAFGGTSIDQWAKGGNLYTEAVRRARAAMKDGTLEGILWHQGETASNPATYAQKAGKLFADLREGLKTPDVPIVVGTLGDFTGKLAQGLNPVLMKLPQSVPNCACADAAGLGDKGDKLHFSAESYRELGRRYAAQWLRLAGIKPPATLPNARASLRCRHGALRSPLLQ
jgi:hypothetical protein